MRAVLLSSEPWDCVWRRNQQLSSRIPGTVFVEPARRGLVARHRREGTTHVLTPAKALPLRWALGRHVFARLAARRIRALTGDEDLVVWATHPLGAEVAAALRAPLVYDRTDDWPAMEQSPRARELVSSLDRALLRDAAVVVVVSESMRRQAGGNARLIANGVDNSAFRLAPRATNGRLRVGFAGTVDPFRVDLQVLHALASEPDVTLVVAGPGLTVPGAENHGMVQHARLPELLAGCDALVAPYRLDSEANHTSDALKLYEYFATGRPVIATPTAGFERYPGLVEWWPPRPTLHDAVRRQEANAGARQEIARGADWSARAEAMRDVLESVVNSR